MRFSMTQELSLTQNFVAQSFRPSFLNDVEISSVAPHDRALLVIDGTVTRYLEAFSGEKIEIELISQIPYTVDSDHRWLDVRKGAELINREVILKGVVSGKVYAYASSQLNLELLSSSIDEFEKLSTVGIGRMLLSGRIEQYRELLWYGAVSSDNYPANIQFDDSLCCLVRTYRIYIQKVPAMMITEYFPVRTSY